MFSKPGRLSALLVFAAAAGTAAASVDLKLTKNAASTVQVGQRLTYSILVHNDSEFIAQSIQVTDVLPEQTRGNVTLTGDGLECFNEAGTVFCTADSLAAGASCSAQISADVAAGNSTSIVNTASVQSVSPELNVADNAGTSTTTLEAEPPASANVSLTATGTPARVQPKSLVTYTVNATNAGPGTALAATLIGELTAGFEFLSAETPIGPCTLDGNLLTCPLGDIAAGQTRGTVVKMRTLKALGTFSSTFFCMPQNPDPDEGDNDAETSTVVDRAAAASFSCCEKNIMLDETQKGRLARRASLKSGSIGVDGKPGPARHYEDPVKRTMELEVSVPISWQCSDLPGSRCVGTFDVEILQEPKQSGPDRNHIIPPESTQLQKTFKRKKCASGKTHFGTIKVRYNAVYPANGPIDGLFEFRVTVPEGKGTLNNVVSVGFVYHAYGGSEVPQIFANGPTFY